MQLVKTDLAPRVSPPQQVGLWRKLSAPYFGTPGNAIITVTCLALIVLVLQKAFTWLVVDAVFTGDPATCKASGGACWPFFTSKVRFMVFGFYPYDEQWRPLAALLLFFAGCGISMGPAFWGRKLLAFWGLTLAALFCLMLGGVFGLSYVPTSKWGGLPLSFMLSFIGLAGAFPLGIVLALARASKLPVIRALAIAFIELVRGVPLISILFMASVMLPLFMPEGLTIDKLLRAQIAIILFAAAYVAEIVRGGLQAIPRGQFEASAAMGLHYWQMMRLIVLPQAIKTMIPPLVTLFIGFFQDTTLVVIVGLLDFLDTIRSAMRDPQWQGIAVLEGYIFAASVYLLFSTIMGVYSRFLERHFRMGHD
ncbi:amino acid ABC transporter permease [Microvirga terricola]|uniref:Amino acid ABC transporter permease n=1 Tax=Microvirga terricola TaxID=2719797 RepID=A0ABX0V7M0_9HYPH|nr:amino acid ABC transporter permease [Microvirga terricola]NIX75842.1 amino acid ABC transporter permease [Microvirga terricola]